MFKKLYERIDDLNRLMRRNFREQSSDHINTRNLMNTLSNSYKLKLDSLHKTIDSQQRTIEQLTNALKDKYEHGLFIFSEDCKIPMVIRNGKELTNDLTSCFSIEWVHGEAPNITIEQFAGTVADSEF